MKNNSNSYPFNVPPMPPPTESRAECDIEMESYKTENSTEQREVVVVDFEDEFEDPFDWPQRWKWPVLLVIALLLFVMPLSSTIISPALGVISQELGDTSDYEGPMLVSLYLLTYCLGTLLFGPLSELFGRVVIMQTGTVLYLIFNLAGGFAGSMDQLLAFRFLSGLGGSASLAVGSSMVGDCFRKEERGLPIALGNLGPVLGSCIGPLVGGFITEYTTWRWAFHAPSILTILVFMLALTVLRESYRPIILQRKKRALSKASAENSIFKTPYEQDHETIVKLYRRTLLRSLHLLGTQPIIQALALYYGYLYGLVYLVLSTFPTLWEKKYHMSTSIGGLNYIAPGCGYVIGAQTCALTADPIYQWLKRRNNGIGKPEFRIPLMIPASFLVPAGLFWYGWSAEYGTHWIVPDLGIALPLAGATIIFQCTSAYLLETFTVYAASSYGAVFFLRGLTGFGFPLFAPFMYRSLGYGWGNTTLGFIAVGIGCPVPFLLWKFGERLRASSSYAEH